jgi:outer membrane receptor protein involved in Fe transport
LAWFLSQYDDLRSAEPQAAAVRGGAIYIPTFLENKMNAKTYGVEAATTYQPMKNWRITGVYSYLHMRLVAEPDSTNSESAEKQTPKHQFSLQSSYDFPKNWQWYSALRYSDELKDFGISEYWVADLGVTWKNDKGLKFSVYGQNLFDAKHFEFNPGSTGALGEARRIQPTVYAKISYEF